MKRFILQLVYIIIFIVAIPSVYFGYELVQREKFSENAGRFINNVSIFEGNFLLKSSIDPVNRIIQLTYGGAALNEEQKNAIKAKSDDFLISDATIEFQQGLTFSELAEKTDEVEKLKFKINNLSQLLQSKELELKSIINKPEMGSKLLSELNQLYTEIITCTYSETKLYSLATRDSINAQNTIPLITIGIRGKQLNKTDEQRIDNWLKTRLEIEDIMTFYYQLQ